MIKATEEIKMNNIISIIKDFFHNPPSFKTDIVLSFKSAASSVSQMMTVVGDYQVTHVVAAKIYFFGALY